MIGPVFFLLAVFALGFALASLQIRLYGNAVLAFTAAGALSVISYLDYQ